MVDMCEEYIQLLALGCLMYQGFGEPACPASQTNNTIHVCQEESLSSESVYIDTDGSPENYNYSCWCTLRRADLSNRPLPVTIVSTPGPDNSERNSLRFNIHGREFDNNLNDSVESGVYTTKDYILFTRRRPSPESSMCLAIHSREIGVKIRVVCRHIDPVPSDGTRTEPGRPSTGSATTRRPRDPPQTSTARAPAPTTTSNSRITAILQTAKSNTSPASTHTSKSRTLGATNTPKARTSGSTHYPRLYDLTDSSDSQGSSDTSSERHSPTLVFIIVGCVCGVVVVVAVPLVIIFCKRRSRRSKSPAAQHCDHAEPGSGSNYYTTENSHYVSAGVGTSGDKETPTEEQAVLLHGYRSTSDDQTYAEVTDAVQQDNCDYAQVHKGASLRKPTESKDVKHTIDQGIASEGVYNITSAPVSDTSIPNDNIYNTFVVEDDYNHLHEVVDPRMTSNNIYGAASDITRKA